MSRRFLFILAILAFLAASVALVPGASTSAAATTYAANLDHADADTASEPEDLRQELGLAPPKAEARSCSKVYANANDATDWTMAGQSVDISLSFSGTISSVSSPSNGTATQISSTVVRYTPDSGFMGSDSFRYYVRGCLQCVSGSCTEPDFDFGTVSVHVD